MVGVLFRGRTETAFAFLTMYQSLVGALVFALAPVLCMRLKIHLGLMFVGCCSVSYTALVLVLRKEKRDEINVSDV